MIETLREVSPSYITSVHIIIIDRLCTGKFQLDIFFTVKKRLPNGLLKIRNCKNRAAIKISKYLK